MFRPYRSSSIYKSRLVVVLLSFHVPHHNGMCAPNFNMLSISNELRQGDTKNGVQGSSISLQCFLAFDAR